MPSNEQYLAVMAPDNGINNKDPVNLIKDSAWSDGNNVRFGPGYVEKAGGWDTFGNDPDPWQANVDYTVGDYCVPNTANGYVYKCSAVGAAPTTAATFTRASVAYKNDGSQVGVEATTNLLPTGSENFVTGWTNNYNGTAITVTPNQPDPWGGNTAYRIQSTGGTSANKYYILISGRPNPHTDIASCYMKVLSGTAGISMGRAGETWQQATTAWSRVVTQAISAASTDSYLFFRCNAVSDNLDVLVCCPQIENKPYVTSYITPGQTRAAVNNVPRYESNGLTIEEGTTNIMPAGSDNFVTGWTAYSSATITVSDYVDTIPGIGQVTCKRIQSTGGTSALKYYCYVAVSNPHTATLSLLMRVLSGNASIYDASCGLSISTGSISWARLVSTITNQASTGISLGIITNAVSDNLDILVYMPQIEAKAYPTSYIQPGQTRAAEICTIPASVLNVNALTIAFDVNVIANTKDLTANHYVLVVSSGTPNNRFLFRHDTTNTWMWYMYAADGVSQVHGSFSDSLIPLGKSRITVTISNKRIEFFVNGVSVSYVDTPSAYWASITSGLYLGSWVNVSNQANTQFSNLHISNIARSDSWIAANGAPGQAISVDGYTSAYFPLTANLTGIMPLYSYIRSQPTFPLSGTVTDGPATWSEVGSNKLDGAVQVIDNYYKYNGDSYLMVITTRKVYYYDDQSKVFVDITGTMPLTGDAKTPVFTENAQNYFVFTNGKDPVKYWNGTGNIANLPGLSDVVPWNDGGSASVVTAKSLLYAKNFLLLFGTTESNGITQLDYPQRLRWSALGDITVWKNSNQELQDKQAGWADLTDGVDWAQCLATLGNYIVAYKERSIQVISYVGGDQTWDKWPAIQGTGLLAPKALMNLGDEHIFIGPDNVYSFDLREVMIAGDDIARRFFDVLDPDNTSLCNSFYFEEIPEGGFNFVSTTSQDGYPDKAIAYNTDTKAWSWRDMPMLCYGYYNLADNPIWDNQDYAWDEAEGGWDSSKKLANAPINLCGDAQGFIYWFNGHSKDGADLDCFIQTKLFDFGNPVLMKRAIRLQLMISREGAYNLPVYVGTAANVDEPITWYGPYNMSLDKTTPPWVDFDITARYMTFKFGTQQKDQPFRLTGYIVYYQTRGPL